MKQAAEIIQEYGPFAGVDAIHGVTCDGSQVWFASGDKLNGLDTGSGKVTRSIAVAAHAGTAFDGQHLYQISENDIVKLDPTTGKVLASIPAPAGGSSGLAWGEGSLWVGQYRERKIHRLDPQTGRILHTIASNRFVTGVSWVDGELWHGTWEDDASELRHIDAGSGAVRKILEMPEGTGISGLEADGADRFYCGGGNSGKLRVVRKAK